MMEPADLVEYEKLKTRELARWRADASASGELAVCPLGDGTWARDSCQLRQRVLRLTAGEASAEQRAITVKLNRCLHCWSNYAGCSGVS